MSFSSTWVVWFGLGIGGFVFFCFGIGLGPCGLVHVRFIGLGGRLVGQCLVGGWVPGWFARVGQCLGNVLEVPGKGTYQAHIGERCMPDVGWKGVG